MLPSIVWVFIDRRWLLACCGAHLLVYLRTNYCLAILARRSASAQLRHSPSARFATLRTGNFEREDDPENNAQIRDG